MLESALKEQLKGIFAGLEANFTFDISVSSSHENKTASSGKFFPLPSRFRIAKSNDVNSCPLGIPRNVIPVRSPFLNKVNFNAS